MIKCFIVYLKIRLLNYVKVPYYVLLLLYERKNDVSSYEISLVIIKNSMKTYQSWHIHRIFDLHAFLLNAHGT